jgi:copper chaperone CopZ
VTVAETITPNAEVPEAVAEGRARLRTNVGGMHCSLCTGIAERTLHARPGVDKVSVSLAHEQALIDYERAVIDPEEILGTLRDIGYDLYDPRKLRPFEEEADLVREGKRQAGEFTGLAHRRRQRPGRASRFRRAVHSHPGPAA